MNLEEKYAGGVSGENRPGRLASNPMDGWFAHPGRYSNANMRFQSFFMLITVQPSFFASS